MPADTVSLLDQEDSLLAEAWGVQQDRPRSLERMWAYLSVEFQLVDDSEADLLVEHRCAQHGDPGTGDVLPARGFRAYTRQVLGPWLDGVPHDHYVLNAASAKRDRRAGGQDRRPERTLA